MALFCIYDAYKFGSRCCRILTYVATNDHKLYPWFTIIDIRSYIAICVVMGKQIYMYV